MEIGLFTTRSHPPERSLHGGQPGLAHLAPRPPAAV